MGSGYRLAFATLCGTVGWALWTGPVFSHNPTITTVLFNREVSAIFQRKCLTCHAEGGMAMPLATYEQARPWAEAIKEEILARRMPPWPAERGYGNFANDSSLTTREIDFLLSWVEGGAPSGDGEPPPVVDHSGHWMLGEPDAVARPFVATNVPALRPPGFERVAVDTGVTTDRWLRALDFKPGDVRVVRAAFFSVEPTGQYLGGWAPSSPTTILPDGAIVRLPAGARIIVDVLYSGTSEDVSAAIQLGLYLSGEQPRRSVTDLVLRPDAIRSRTQERVRAELVLTSDQTLLALRPQLPPTGRSLQVVARRPDGSSEILLWIRRYRHDWQTPYVLQRPVSLLRGTVVQATAHGDEWTTATQFAVTMTTVDGDREAVSPRAER